MRRVLFAFAIVAAMVVSVGMASASEGPNKVWVCHFDGHSLPEADYFSADGETITGDYVINWHAPDGDPGGFCAGVGGDPILISVNAVGSDEDVRGHGAQLTDRIGDYPDGWKG